MVKVDLPLHSGDARGQFGKKIIFTRGGYARNYFRPRNPNSIAQQNARQAFKENYVAGLTQEQADLLYAAIEHFHDERYALLTPRRVLLPFGVYNTINPISVSNLIPYLYGIDRAMHYKSVTIKAYVGDPNNGSNYWLISLHQGGIGGGNVKVFSTVGGVALTWLTFSATTFDISSADIDNIFVRVVVTKVGLPGVIYIAGPSVEVEID